MDGCSDPRVAFVAVGARVLIDGLALDRDRERYQEYRAEVTDLLARFGAAQEAREKYHLMVDMERAAYEEMRSFLRSAESATFVM